MHTNHSIPIYMFNYLNWDQYVISHLGVLLAWNNKIQYGKLYVDRQLNPNKRITILDDDEEFGFNRNHVSPPSVRNEDEFGFDLSFT